MLLTSSIVIGGVLYVGSRLHNHRTQLQAWATTLSPQKMLTNCIQSLKIGKKAHNQEEQLQKNFIASSCSLGVASIGYWLYPPATLLALPMVLHQSLPLFQQAWNSLSKEQRLHVSLLDSVVVSFCLMGGSPFVVALNGWFVAVRNKQTYKMQHTAWENLLRQYNIAAVQAMPSPPEASFPITDSESDSTSHATSSIIPHHSVPAAWESEEISLYIQSGELIPIDGVILEGGAWVDEHNLRGASKPVTKGVGDTVFATTLVLVGHIRIQGNADPMTTLATHIAQTLAQTARQKLFAQIENEKRANQITKGLLGLGGLTALTLSSGQAITLLNSRPGYGFETIPSLCILALLQKARDNGLLIKASAVFQRIEQVDTFLFDLQLLRTSANALQTLEWLRSHKKQSIYLLANEQTIALHDDLSILQDVREIAAEFGADRIFVASEHCDKVSIIAQLQACGHNVCYIGEGLHEASVMQQADLSIAVPTPSQLCATSFVKTPAHIVIVNEQLPTIRHIYELSSSLKQECDSTYQVTLVPGLVAVAGALLLNTTLLTSVLLNNLSAFVAYNKIERSALAATAEMD